LVADCPRFNSCEADCSADSSNKTMFWGLENTFCRRTVRGQFDWFF
jgi:hypothetical protein